MSVVDKFYEIMENEDWDFETYPYINVLIDIANGHMSKLHNLIYEKHPKNLPSKKAIRTNI